MGGMVPIADVEIDTARPLAGGPVNSRTMQYRTSQTPSEVIISGAVDARIGIAPRAAAIADWALADRAHTDLTLGIMPTFSVRLSR